MWGNRAYCAILNKKVKKMIREVVVAASPAAYLFM